uniref:BTB/POZ domain-containing protein At1g03010 n=1 Tax=Anthurium amnicola TaxID=1678845 RepID=A0A1D1XI57_9ARAE
MGVVEVTELKQSTSTKRTFRPSLSTRHNADWPLSDVSSDLTVEVGTTNFSLHKFPLVSRSGKIRKLLSEAKDPKVSRINLQMIPGGADAFELAAKFCYGVNIDITLSNVATLRCTAHYLQMTEEFSENNLESCTEAYLKEAVLPSIPNSITALHHCESLLPTAEETNLVGSIVAEIAANACKEQLTSGLSKLESLQAKPTKAEADPEPDWWWGKSLSVLNLDFFQRVVSAVRSKGLKQDTVCRILINYAHNSLQGLGARAMNPSAKGCFSDAETQKKRRSIVETVVGLLPNQSRKSPVPMGFLSGLLKAATLASASAICRADLERRIALQLEHAILEDILIPASPCSNNRHQLYDTDVVLRIFTTFLSLEQEEEEDGENGVSGYELDSPGSPRQSVILKVSKLMNGYLAESALDSNLMPSKFIALAELLPAHDRVVGDGLYRAVDIYLKVHPNIKESERYRLCKTIDCQKLSQEACSHAAQNERLPVQMAVQVLYFEQLRLRNAMNRGHDQFFLPQRSGSAAGSGAASPRDNYALVRRENRELKLEVARMRMRLTDLEKDHVSMKQELVRSNPANNVLRSFTRKLAKLNEIFRLWEKKAANAKTSAESRLLFQKRRRHSAS